MNCSGKQSESQTWSKEGAVLVQGAVEACLLGPGPQTSEPHHGLGLLFLCDTHPRPGRQRVVSRGLCPPCIPRVWGFSWLGCWFCRVPGRFQVAVSLA